MHHNIELVCEVDRQENSPMEYPIPLSSKKPSIRIPKCKGVVNGKSPREDLLEADQGLIQTRSIQCRAVQIPGAEVKLHQ